MNNQVCSSLDELVSRAIIVYKRYRSPEATAKLVEAEEDSFILEFKGPFCQSCGVTEYFEDFTYDLADVNGSLMAEVKAVEPTNQQSFKVHYIVRDDFSGSNIEDETLFSEFLQAKSLSFEDYLASNTYKRRDQVPFSNIAP